MVHVVLVQPLLEPCAVRPAAFGGVEHGEHRLGDILLVPLPGDHVRRELEIRNAPAVRERGRRIGDGVTEDQLGAVALERLGQLRQRLDGVIEERLQIVDQLRAPGFGIVVGAGQYGGVDHRFRAGGRDLRGEGGGDRVTDAVPPGDQFPDDLQARVHMPVGGDGEHGDMGTLRRCHGPTVGETRRLVQLN